jgi:hypothetical protein
MATFKHADAAWASLRCLNMVEVDFQCLPVVLSRLQTSPQPPINGED